MLSGCGSTRARLCNRSLASRPPPPVRLTCSCSKVTLSGGLGGIGDGAGGFEAEPAASLFGASVDSGDDDDEKGRLGPAPPERADTDSAALIERPQPCAGRQAVAVLRAEAFASQLGPDVVGWAPSSRGPSRAPRWSRALVQACMNAALGLPSPCGWAMRGRSAEKQRNNSPYSGAGGRFNAADSDEAMQGRNLIVPAGSRRLTQPGKGDAVAGLWERAGGGAFVPSRVVCPNSSPETFRLYRVSIVGQGSVWESYNERLQRKGAKL